MLLNKVKPKKLSVTCHKFGNSRFTLNATFTIQELHKSPSKKEKEKKSYTSFLIIAPSPISIVPKKKKKNPLQRLLVAPKKKWLPSYRILFCCSEGKKKKKEKRKKKKRRRQIANYTYLSSSHNKTKNLSMIGITLHKMLNIKIKNKRPCLIENFKEMQKVLL